MTSRILLCSDLDRTILPNGAQPESTRARPLLRALAGRDEITLAYVSGRHQALLQQAIDEFDIPVPDFAIGDVGTTIYEIQNGNWQPWQHWYNEIAPDWNGKEREDLHQLFMDINMLELQEPEKQNVFKLSYYAPQDCDTKALLNQMRKRLTAENVRASLIWSIDEITHVGLLDVLPERATKLHAIEFLMKQKHFGIEQTVFAGDSGNDLPVLTSKINSVLVKNAREDVRKEALSKVNTDGHPGSLYLAQGDFMDMNGNYSAGVLEGLAHFIPESKAWLTSAI
jgi:HAD superfamily hydrolase (TIGR01484 family)